MERKLVRGLPGFPGQRGPSGQGGGNFSFPTYILYVATDYDGEPNPNYQFTTIQNAINKATTLSPSETQPVTIYIAPGLYVEDITLSPFVSLVGAGLNSTFINGSATYIDETATGNSPISIYSLSFLNSATTLTLTRNSDGNTIMILEDVLIFSHIITTGNLHLNATNIYARDITLSGSSSFFFRNCIITEGNMIINRDGIFHACAINSILITINNSNITMNNSSINSQIILEGSYLSIYNSHIDTTATVDATSSLIIHQCWGNRNITGEGVVGVDRLDTTVEFTGVDTVEFNFLDIFGFLLFHPPYTVTMTPLNNSSAIGTIVLLQSQSFTLSSNLPGTIESPVRYSVGIIAQSG